MYVIITRTPAVEVAGVHVVRAAKQMDTETELSSVDNVQSVYYLHLVNQKTLIKHFSNILAAVTSG